MNDMRLYGALRHWSWAPTFNNTQLIDWLFDQTKSTPYITGFTDGSFKPNQAVTRSQMAVMLAKGLHLKSAVATPSWPDVTSNWAKDEIAKVVEQGIMRGVSESQFAPEQTVTRAQMAVIVSNLVKEQSQVSTTSYSDVPFTHWALQAIQYAGNVGIMQGYGNNTFKPNEAITRAEAVKVLNQVFDRNLDNITTTPRFNDVSVQHWAYKDIEAAARP